jgi:hypothetical protein
MKRMLIACTALAVLAPTFTSLPASAHRHHGWELPGGSWSESCARPEMRGPILVAQCQGVDGGWYDTSIDMRACRSGSVANVNGNLVCS